MFADAIRAIGAGLFVAILAAAFLFYAITLQREATATDCGLTAARGVDVSNVAECAR